VAEKEITIEIKKPELIFLLVFFTLVLALELQVTFGTPISFGDEGFHTRFAQYIAENREFPIFTVIEETKLSYGGFVRPPLLNILEASLFSLFGTSNDLPIRFLTPFVSILTGVVTFLLVKRLYNEKAGFIASVLAITIPSFVTYSVMFYTDVLYTLYATLFFLLFLLAIKENNKKYLILSGIFGGLAFLTDLSGLAIYIFIPLAFIYEAIITKAFVNQFKKYFILILILILVSSAFFLRNIYYFNHPLCRSLSIGIGFIDKFINKIFDLSKCSVNKFEPKYQFAGRTEQVGTEQTVYSMGITNYLNFAYGNLLLVVFGFFAGLMLLLMKRDRTVDLLIIYFLIFLFLFYGSTQRAEDTARNTLGWVPIIALVSAEYFSEIYEFAKKYLKQFALIIFVAVLIASFFNFREKLDIMFRVKQFSPAFFEACDWVKNNLPKNASLYTIWSHRAVYNCQRNAVGTSRIPDIALSKDVNYTIEVAKQNEITHIFIQKFSIDVQNRHLSEMYDADFVQFLEDNPKAFVKVYENGPSFNLTNRSVRDWVYYCYQTIGTICDGNVIYEVNYAYLI
jgi:4-amino-4-deoxy-L-arabinose transferase-like glycosyltransferase